MDHSGGGESGTGEVHSHLGTRPGPDRGPAREDLGTAPDARFESPMARARRLTEGPLREVRGRAGREGTRALTVIQENPVIAVGAAFALGFLLAGRSDPTRGFGKKKQQLRGAIVGAAAAALTQEARDLLEREGGIAGLLGGLFGADPPLDEEDEEGFTEGAEDDDPLDYYASEEEEDEEYDPDHQL